MGCCESSGYKHYKLNIKRYPSEPYIYAINVMNACPLNEKFKSSLRFNNDSISEEDLNSALPANINQIETISYRLLYLPDWVVKENCTSLRVECRKGSFYNNDLPVMLAYIDFGLNIPAEKILYILFNPQARLNWDSKVKNMKIVNKIQDSHFIIKYETEHNSKNWENVLEVAEETELQETIVSYHSIQLDRDSDSEEVLRGKVIFGFIKIIVRDDSTLMMLMTQEECCSQPQLSSYQVSKQFCEWLECFRSEVLRYHTLE